MGPKQIAILLSLLIPTPMMGQGLWDCGGMARLTQAATAGFQAPLPQVPGAEWCRTARSATGATTLHCAWGFDFRDPKARAMFDGMGQAITECYPNHTEAGPDQTVNHPDSFDLRQFDLDGVAVSLSLKDKGALGKTYVFLGVGS